MTALDLHHLEQRGLSALLRYYRQRLDPHARALGRFSRLPARVGKSVTQEEVAEAVEVSRQWYMMMENARAARVSPAVLGRVADVLMLEPAERATLFRLGIPELFTC